MMRPPDAHPRPLLRRLLALPVRLLNAFARGLRLEPGTPAYRAAFFLYQQLWRWPRVLVFVLRIARRLPIAMPAGLEAVIASVLNERRLPAAVATGLGPDARVVHLRLQAAIATERQLHEAPGRLPTMQGEQAHG